jgi:two-component system, OmpR family, osmolarity sensor histidine kinase EnvZ
MTFAWLKRYAPKSLYGRAALILLLPVVTLQIVASVVFVQRLFEDVTEQMTGNVALELRYLRDIVEAAPDDAAARAALAPVAAALGMTASLPDARPVGGTSRAPVDLSGRLVIRTLAARVPGFLGVDLRTDDNLVDLTILTGKGPLGLAFDRDRVSPQNPHQFLVIIMATALLFTFVAYLFLKNQLRPIKRLARAASAFGRGRSVPYRPAGAIEVREAGTAFLDMRHRIERQIEQRTTMLSGVSHDLRTPLTRLGLGLEMIDDPEAEAMRGDVAEMRRMLDAFLDFAREGALDEPEATDPAGLVRDIAAKNARAGGAIELGALPAIGPVMMRPLTVARALDNLVANALRHGSRCRLTLSETDRAVVFRVEDDGPGIPEPDREDAMRAFTRLDAARNQDLGGGVGLGLAIARDVARQHGGTLRLDRSAHLGGLQAELVLAR